MGAKVIMVIVTDLELRGCGTQKKPFRKVTQYWTLEGKLLCENDPYNEDQQEFKSEE